MSDTYLEFNFTIVPTEPARDILIAELAELGFESFVEHDKGLNAYVLKKQVDAKAIADLFVVKNKAFTISWFSKEIEQENWNAIWEQSFEPITVDDKCVVRAPFHPKANVSFDIVIEPKMSFGTGHHETTHMMLTHMLNNDFKDKSVLDMGCGTGVLAILAEMKGAKKVDAIDIDEWSCENTKENSERNNCTKITAYLGDASLLKDKSYDVVLANINRNILLEDIPLYVRCLKKNGNLFVSGFYKDDLAAISSKCASLNLRLEKKLEKNNWVSAKYVF